MVLNTFFRFNFVWKFYHVKSSHALQLDKNLYGVFRIAPLGTGWQYPLELEFSLAKLSILILYLYASSQASLVFLKAGHSKNYAYRIVK